MDNYDIVALGESLIDFVATPGKDKQKIVLEGNAGGAPVNVLAAAAKLGRRTGFIGKVGGDLFGRFLHQRIEEAGVDTAGLTQGSQPTTLAVVSLDEGGDRSFFFYRGGTADVMLDENDLNDEMLRHCRIFHFGTLSMTEEPARTATLAAVARAKEAGALISFDPNYRPGAVALAPAGGGRHAPGHAAGRFCEGVVNRSPNAERGAGPPKGGAGHTDAVWDAVFGRDAG